MNMLLDSRIRNKLAGRVSLLLLWILGIPLPVILLIWLFRG
jgi:hypothetical protein